jgi:hypothetical protein
MCNGDDVAEDAEGSTYHHHHHGRHHHHQLLFFPDQIQRKKGSFFLIHFSSVEMYISLCSQGKFSHLHFKTLRA